MTDLSKQAGAAGTMPLVCICVPTYNAAKTIRASLESILAQTYPNLLVRVSDNASTDDTVAVIAAMGEPRVSVHVQESNLGAEGNFTQCIALASGAYTAIFHADDLYLPEMVARQVALLEAHPDTGAVFTEAATIDDDGRVTGAIGRSPTGTGGVSHFTFQQLLKATLEHHNFLVCPSAMVRTHIYKEQIGVWGNSLFRSSSDVDTWLRIASRQPVALIGEQLMRYRISSAQFTAAIRNRTERTDFFAMMDDYLARPAVRALLTERDLRHYGWLERHETVARALNLIVAGRIGQADQLTRGVLGGDAWRAALHSRRAAATLAAALFVRLAVLSGASGTAAAVVRKIKRLSWK